MSINIKSHQLGILLDNFEELSKTVLTQFHIVEQYIKNSSENLIKEAEDNEILIDNFEIKIREEIIFAILQFNPKASDLRKIMAYHDITIYLERIGDLLLNIVHFVQTSNFDFPEFVQHKKAIVEMQYYASEMVKDAIFAFSNEDCAQAYRVIANDDKVDDLFHKINTSLRTNFSDTTISQVAMSNILNISGISQNLERIGDNATNIAESIIFLIEGRDIRHTSKL